MTAPSAAADDERDLLRVWFRMARLNARIAAAIGQRLREAGLSIPQFDALSTLTEEDGISQQQLAERLYVTKGNVSGLVNRLAGQGLVKRSAIEGDRRSYALTLTAKGRALAEEGIRIHNAYVAATLGRMPRGERDLLGDLLTRLRERVREDDAGVAPASAAARGPTAVA